jgi:hypothetical protein
VSSFEPFLCLECKDSKNIKKYLVALVCLVCLVIVSGAFNDKRSYAFLRSISTSTGSTGNLRCIGIGVK